MGDLLGLRVLVIEPNRPLGSVLADALTLAGAQVVNVCGDLAGAARAFGSETAQALIVGTRSCQDPASAMRSAQTWGLPVLLICDRRVEVSFAQGRCLPKPFCFHDLVESLSAAARHPN